VRRGLEERSGGFDVMEEGGLIAEGVDGAVTAGAPGLSIVVAMEGEGWLWLYGAAGVAPAGAGAAEA
jgi:hypothetical protein